MPAAPATAALYFDCTSALKSTMVYGMVTVMMMKKMASDGASLAPSDVTGAVAVGDVTVVVVVVKESWSWYQRGKKSYWWYRR